ncbi:MAG: PAS domain-containing protein [Novosphingobium sp.]
MEPVSQFSDDPDNEGGPGGALLFPATAADTPIANILSMRTVLNNIDEGFILLDPDQRILEVNAQALRYTTKRREELIGQLVWEAYPGTAEHPSGALYKRALVEKRMVSFEEQFVLNGANSGWLDMRVYPMTCGGLAIFFRDVSDRHANEARLRKSEMRFRAAIEAADGVLWTSDGKGHMTEEQPGWAKLTGQTLGQYAGQDWLKAVHPDDAEPTLIAWNAAVAAREPFIFEHRVKRHDGVFRHFSIRAIPVSDDDGNLLEWVGVHTDVTDATEARQQLARNAETFADLVRNNPFGIFVVDGDLRLLHLSQGAAKTLAHIGPVIGQYYYDVIAKLWTKPYTDNAVSAFRKARETGETFVGLTTIETHAGATMSYDWRIERVILPDSSDGVVCYFYDLSEHMRLEQELRQALSDKDVLAREIEHRVRNSLAIVSGLLMLQRASARNTETKDALAAASSRVLAIGRVHERLYRLTDGDEIEFGSYLEQMCRDIARTVSGSNISFDVQTSPVHLTVDTAVPLGIVANELITNACKYCDIGAAALVTVRLAINPGSTVLTVTDTGPGVPADFDPEGEAGLGLRAIQVLVRQIHGSIKYPEAGREARFEITVPLPPE